jgi:hypothetical protein
MQNKEDVPTQSQIEAELSLGISSIQEVLATSIRTIPTKEEDAILDLLEFCSPMQVH